MNSLTKDRRIRKNNEYQLVYKHGRYEVGRLCVIREYTEFLNYKCSKKG